ncbi:MAG: PorV/PorQ family protein [Elusimicrobia bacterium]|nr:PorV/PorQ family protein [Elusimicrobiota bacterium]
MRARVLFAAALLLASVPVRAVEPAVGRGGGVLKAQPGARPRGMGGAFSAVADDVNALFSNPAGLGGLRHYELTAMNRWYVGDITQGHVGLVVPLENVSSRDVRTFGSFGAYYRFIDYGRLPGRDAAGNPQSGDGFNARDGVLALGYGKFISRQLAIGANAKLYGLEIADQEAKGSAFDVGLLFRPRVDGWTLSLAGFNFGNDLRFESEDEKLPKFIVAGISFQPLPERLLLAMDVVDPQDDVVEVKAGAEWWASRILALRAGYDSGDDIGSGVTAGIGLQIREMEASFFPIRRLSIDYSFVPFGDLLDDNAVTSVHNISITLRFGDRD